MTRRPPSPADSHVLPEGSQPGPACKLGVGRAGGVPRRHCGTHPTQGELGRPVSAWRLEWAGQWEPLALGRAFGLVMCSFDKCLLWQPHCIVWPATSRGIWFGVTSEEVPGRFRTEVGMHLAALWPVVRARSPGTETLPPSLVFLPPLPAHSRPTPGEGGSGVLAVSPRHLRTDQEQRLGSPPTPSVRLGFPSA